nr:MAG TPA: hypothetical protein [Caudoviricetes sp.]
MLLPHCRDYRSVYLITVHHMVCGFFSLVCGIPPVW